MKKCFTILFALCMLSHAWGQKIEYGPKISLGAGFMKSNNLQQYFDFKNNQSDNLKEYEVRSKLGPSFSIGGFVSYGITEKLSLVGELGYSHTSANMRINRMSDDSQNTLSQRQTTKSDNKISINSFSIPLILRYQLSESFYINCGLGIDFVLNNKLKYNEEYKDESLDFLGNSIDIRQSIVKGDADIDQTENTRFSFALGGGTKLDIGEKGLYIDLRYNLPLTQSTMYSSEALVGITTRESEVFGAEEKADILDDGFNLNDFKMGSITIAVAVPL